MLERNGPREDFGESFVRRQPALHVALTYLPATLKLVFIGMAFAALLAVVAGVLAALRPGHLMDRAITFASLIGLSMPQFWLGLLLIIVFGVKFGSVPGLRAAEARPQSSSRRLRSGCQAPADRDDRPLVDDR